MDIPLQFKYLLNIESMQHILIGILTVRDAKWCYEHSI